MTTSADLHGPERKSAHDLVALVQDGEVHPEISGLRTVLPEIEEMAAVDRDCCARP